MTVNINPTTGIRYGVIALNDLDQDVVTDLLYGIGVTDVSSNEAAVEARKVFTKQAEDDGIPEDEREDWIDQQVDREMEALEIGESVFEGELDGVKYRTFWLGGSHMIFVFESPVTGHFRLCSPCIPNAADLSNPDPDGYEGYDVPANWRSND